MPVELPAVGSRVSLRYRLPAGSDKPLTDVVGYLDRGAPDLLVRTKSGELVEVALADVVSVRELSHTPVRTSEIRAVEHAAAMAWPGVEHHWLHGWFLRNGHGFTSRANSAVPLDVSAHLGALADVAAWYRERGLPARLALPERLLPVRTAGTDNSRVMVRDIAIDPRVVPVRFADVPDGTWLQGYQRDVPADVLTAVVDGEVTFATSETGAVARGAVTPAPDGTGWLGISALRVPAEQRRRGQARDLCSALLAWGTGRGATRAYVRVPAENTAAVALFTGLGFRLHHGHRYVDAESLLGFTI
ncbi:GNAT family N-acetyltransferase [[Mycobacterium] wendilense]|uniref:GNAT family N-acetyltransferase n=1 Tax=[Mycobacterium] wendilense TaxID=3064284 RepID=A0ABM9MI62_9MYCO|nr:GNAT family N-acetyltransferase [Mycolicibacterium sp. MU0050]CAJ1585785.1 GNAT family N-acetyltransferase [Mycolicibacterium sp. MU0050]